MEEYIHKLNTNNPILIARTVSSLLEKILESYKLCPQCKEKRHKHCTECQQKRQRQDTKELKFLKEKCLSSNSLVSFTANKALISLVAARALDVSATISELVSMLMNAGSYAGIIYAIYELLKVELAPEIDKIQPYGTMYESRYNMIVPQHPFITVLLHNSHTWIDIFGNVNQIQNKKLNDSVCTRYLTHMLMRPFYLYVFCDYNNKVLPVFREKLWTHWMSNYFEEDFPIYMDVFIWMRIDDKERLFEAAQFLVAFVDAELALKCNFTRLEALSVLVASFIYSLLSRNMAVKQLLLCLKPVILQNRNINSVNCILMLLAESIAICPVIYLQDLLEFCAHLLPLGYGHNLIVKTLKASCLQWMLQSSLLTAPCDEFLMEIIGYCPMLNETDPSTKLIHKILINKQILKSNEQAVLARDLCILTESNCEDHLFGWLSEVANAPKRTVKRISHYLLGILMCSFSTSDTTAKVLQILLSCAEVYPELTTNILTVVLFKLSASVHTSEHFVMLKALPKLGTLKENLPIIVSTLQVLASSQQHMKTFVMTLYYDLWLLQVRCYPLLQGMLVQNHPESDVEFHTTKAHILMKLCEKRPELYGTELAAHLSKVLNKCKGPDGGLASSFALQGLKHLCREGIVDIATAWRTLEPSFVKESRVVVLQSLCDLLTEVATLPETGVHDSLVSEVTNKLWEYATYHPDIDVNIAAFKALGCFTLEQISAHVLTIIEEPNTYPDNFGYIPGTAWISLLQNGNYASMNAAGDLLITLVSLEISGYLKGTYHIGEGRKEPENFNSLYYHSIVRALGNHVKTNVSKFEQDPSNEVYLQCLRVLSQEYHKPLPPFDWCFLQELIHIPSARGYCLAIASKQVVLSGTARRFMENFIITVTNVTNNNEDIASIYNNLKFLTNSIQPMLIKPFVENTFRYVMEKENYDLLNVLLTNIKIVLKNKEIQDINKSVISQVLTEEMKTLGQKHAAFEKYLDCIITLPDTYLQDLISLKNSAEMSSQEIQLAVKVRCAIAKTQQTSPFSILDEAITVVSCIRSEQNYLLEQMKEVFHKHKSHEGNMTWTMDFLGQVQVKLADKKYANVREFLYLFDVFMMAVIIFAGNDVMEDVMFHLGRLDLFPQSLALLLKNKEWNNCVSQMLEWLHFMTQYEMILMQYRRAFCEALAALRHEDIFTESHRWMKYVGTKI